MLASISVSHDRVTEPEPWNLFGCIEQERFGSSWTFKARLFSDTWFVIMCVLTIFLLCVNVFYQTHWDPLEAWSAQLCESWSHPSQSDNRQSSSPHTVICASLYPWCCSRNKVAHGGGWIKHDALARFQWPVWSAVIQISTPDVQLQVVFKVGFHPQLCLFHQLWEMLLSKVICLFTHVLLAVFIINQSLKCKKKTHSKSTKHSCVCVCVWCSRGFSPGHCYSSCWQKYVTTLPRGLCRSREENWGYWRMRRWSHAPILSAGVYISSEVHRLASAPTTAWNNMEGAAAVVSVTSILCTSLFLQGETWQWQWHHNYIFQVLQQLMFL